MERAGCIHTVSFVLSVAAEAQTPTIIIEKEDRDGVEGESDGTEDRQQRLRRQSRKRMREMAARCMDVMRWGNEIDSAAKQQ